MATNVYLQAKIEERTSQTAVLENLQKQAADKSRDMTEDERRTFDELTRRLAFLDDEIKRITAAEQASVKFTEIYGQHRQAAERAEELADRRRAQAEQRQVEGRASWGERFVENLTGQRFSGHGSSQPFVIAGAHWLDLRADVSGPYDINDMPRPVQLVPGPRLPATRSPLFDVIGRQPTGLGSVEYYYWQYDPDSAAAVVPEGELKPEAPIRGDLRAVPIETYAWHKGITRQALEDVPGIRAVVDDYLRRGVLRRIETSAADALNNDTNIRTVAGGGDLLAAIRVGIAEVEDTGYQASAVLLNPADWASLDIGLLGSTLNGPVIGAQFFGVRPVASSRVPAGTAYVGDFGEAVTYFDRDTVNIIVTDSHADFFLRNKLVILAEARGRVVGTTSAAVVKIGGDAGGGTPPAASRLQVSAQPAAAASNADVAAAPSVGGSGGGGGAARSRR